LTKSAFRKYFRQKSERRTSQPSRYGSRMMNRRVKMTQSGCSLRRSVASIKAAIFLTTLVHFILIPARENLLSHVREPLTHLRVSQGVDRGVEFVRLGALNACRLPRPKNGDSTPPARQSQARMIRSPRKAKELGYPHEPWTTRLLASHAREHGPRMGMAGSPSWPRAPCARSSMRRR
jgi:hypothetical protein